MGGQGGSLGRKSLGGSRRGQGQGPRGNGMMRPLRPQMLRPNQPFRQFRPRPQQFGQNLDGQPPRNFGSNQPPFEGFNPTNGFNQNNKRQRENSVGNEAKKQRFENVTKPLNVLITPKNAMNCLKIVEGDVDKSLEYQQPKDNRNKCKIASIKLKNTKVTGFGATDELAQRIVSENALRTLIDVHKPTNNFTINSTKDQELGSWNSVVSFALFKLLTDWNEGRIGLQPRDNFLATAGMIPLPKPQIEVEKSQIAIDFLNCKDVTGKLAPNHAEFHPSVLLNALIPQLEVTKTDVPPNRFKVTAKVNGIEFSGEDTNVKTARARLAVNMFKKFEITFAMPAKLAN